MSNFLAFIIGLVLGPIVAVAIMALALVCMGIWRSSPWRYPKDGPGLTSQGEANGPG